MSTPIVIKSPFPFGFETQRLAQMLQEVAVAARKNEQVLLEFKEGESRVICNKVVRLSGQKITIIDECTPITFVKLQKDGDHWCALIGSNLQEGVAGFGDTPRTAIENLTEQPEFNNHISV